MNESKLTIFAIPKPFAGHIGDIQYNAIKSWSLLSPRPEIILLGDEPGTEHVAKELGARQIADIARNKKGTPLLNDLFAKAKQASSDDSLLAYVNADIILFDGFVRAVEILRGRYNRFLMVGRRRDFSQAGRMCFDDPAWAASLQSAAASRGFPHNQEGMDYFVFRKDMFVTVPPFAIGRCAWDQWLLNNADAPVIDASGMVLAVHQNHAFAPKAGGRPGLWEGAEAAENRQLAGRMSRMACYEADFALKADGSIARSITEPLLREQAGWQMGRIAWCLRQARFFFRRGLTDAAVGMLEEAQSVPHRARDDRLIEAHLIWIKKSLSAAFLHYAKSTAEAIVSRWR